MRTITIPAETVRGIWATDAGQPVEQWVPAGRYDVIPGEITVRGMTCQSIVPLPARGNGAFYVPVSVLAKL